MVDESINKGEKQDYTAPESAVENDDGKATIDPEEGTVTSDDTSDTSSTRADGADGATEKPQAVEAKLKTMKKRACILACFGIAVIIATVLGCVFGVPSRSSSSASSIGPSPSSDEHEVFTGDSAELSLTFEIYEDMDKLKDDLTTMFQFFADNYIQSMIGNLHCMGPMHGDPDDSTFHPVGGGGGNIGSSPSEAATTTITVDDGDDSFGTNNQEHHVDEVDMYKSDGRFIFIVQYNTLIIARADTNQMVGEIDLLAGASDEWIESNPFDESGIDSGILLSDTTIAVVLSGTGDRELTPISRVVRHEKATRVLLFSLDKLYSTNDFTNVDKSNILTYIGEEYLDGRLIAAYTIDSEAVIVTTSGINREAGLIQPISQLYFELGEDDDRFAEKAKELAPTLVDSHVTKLLRDLETTPGVFPDIVKLDAPTMSASNGAKSTNAAFCSGYANHMVGMSKFDMKPLQLDTSSGLNVETLVQFLPSPETIPYATKDYLILSNAITEEFPEIHVRKKTTTLRRYKIQDDKLVPEKYGSVLGTIPNKHWIDNVDGQLRVVSERFAADDFRTTNGESNVINEMFILEDHDDDGKSLDVVGTVKFGKPNELITGIVFRKDKAYAVTFRYTDPFYVFDLTEPTNPTIVGSLDVPGFSDFLIPINDASTIVLGIGSHVNATDGSIDGIKLSLFDAQDPDNAKELWTYHGQYEKTDAIRYDKAWRYVRETDEQGILIIPLIRHKYFPNGGYEVAVGFAVFSVSINAGIVFLYDIYHERHSDECYDRRWLSQQRSFVIDGNIITHKQWILVSTDMNTGDKNWDLPLVTDAYADEYCNIFP